MIRCELQGLQEALGRFDSQPVRRAAKDTLNKVGKTARTVVSEEIRRIYNVKKSDLDKRIELLPTRSDDLVKVIEISGRSMSLSYFGARQFVVNRTITRGKGGLVTKTRKTAHKFQGVEVEVVKGRKTQLKSAFMAKMQSGHIGVMRRMSGKMMRKHPKKQAIAEKAVISIAYMVRTAKAEPVILQRVVDAWNAEFPRRLEYLLGKGKGQ